MIRKCGNCSILSIPKEVCSIEFTDLKEEILEASKDIGYTCRGELVIVYFNDKGKIVEIELAGGDKLCSQ